MGDGGALLLGLLMAASTMLVGGQTDDPFSGQAFFFFLPLFIPFFVIGVPILDTAVRHRAPGPQARSSPAEADKDHLHHRLMRLGHGQRRSVLILWAWTAILSGFVLYPVVHRARATPSCRSAWRPSAWCCTPTSTPASGVPAAQSGQA